MACGGFNPVISKVCGNGKAAIVHQLHSEMGNNPVYVPYVTGKTWTTDGLYLETRAKMEARTAEGCITVEMEAAAFFAVAQFRGVTLAQLLYGGDDLSGDQWDHRDWLGQVSTREKLFWLAAEAVLTL